MSKNSDITAVLKGLAIAFVLVAHYASNYAEDFYLRWMTEYAIAFIGLFFVLSGYGICHSLERRLAGGVDRTILLKFAWDRAIRIYPFYWLALISISLLMPGIADYERLYQPGIKSFLIWSGIPLARFSLLWFVAAIIQCYWLAPVFYLVFKKAGIIWSYLLVAALTGCTLLISSLFYLPELSWSILPARSDLLVFFYKGYFLGNVVLFALGMLIVFTIEKHAAKLEGRAALVASTALFLASIYLLRFPDLVFSYSELFLVPLFFFGAFWFCLCAIVNQPRLPLSPFFSFLGRHSYTIYLFHYQFLTALALLGLIREGYAPGALVALALLPLLLLVCAGIGSLSTHLEKLLGRWATILLDKKKAGPIRA